MGSRSRLEDKVPSSSYYMNKIFGRGLEQIRSLERNGKGGRALGLVSRVTIEPRSGGGHLVRVERSRSFEHGVPASVDRIGPALTSEHSFGNTGDAIHFLNDVLTGRMPKAPGGGEAGRFLDQVLD